MTAAATATGTGTGTGTWEVRTAAIGTGTIYKAGKDREEPSITTSHHLTQKLCTCIIHTHSHKPVQLTATESHSRPTGFCARSG